VLFVGDDWAEAHHDIEIENEEGRVLARRRLRRAWRGSRPCTSWLRSIWIRRPNRIRCWSELRPIVGRGCRRC
jgi:hypothetical protein